MKRSDLRKVVIAFFSLAISLFSNHVFASHAMGADLTYTCLGNNQYEVTYTLYRDCFGIPAPASVSIDVDNNCNFGTQSLTFNEISSMEISPLCSTAVSTCHGGNDPGIEEHVYRGIVTLPGDCASWNISHSESSRNAAITTIPGASGDDLYVYANINNTNGLCNSSPIFSNRPIPFACAGQNFTFNHGAYDADGDSLVYELITPLQGQNSPVIYQNGYSATQPVISNPPMHFSTATGDINMVPAQVDVTVLAVLVNEYRNGVLIGQVERDIQLTVQNCTNRIPNITGMNGVPNAVTARLCAGNPVCFYIASTDADVGDSTTITWDQTIIGATFTHNNPQPRRDTANFCWTPTSSDISYTPHCFTATVHDTHCSIIGTNVITYCITVDGVFADAGPDVSVPCGTTINLNGNATFGDGHYTYVWLPGDSSQMLQNVGVGEYYLSVQSLGCTNVDTVRVTPGAGVPVANFYVQGNCSGAPVQFFDSSYVTASTIGSWYWDFGDGAHDNIANPLHQYAANGHYTVTLISSTVSNCTDTIVKDIIVDTNIPTAQFTSIPVCQGTPMNFADQSSGAGLNGWFWNFNDAGSPSNTSNSQNAVHTFNLPGTYSVLLSVTNVDGCNQQVSHSVTVNANPVINFPDAGMCVGAQATLTGPASYAAYSWTSGETTQSITVSPAANTPYTLTVTDANSCSGSYTANVLVDPLPIPFAGTDQRICEGDAANLSGSGGLQYTWNPGNISGQNIIVYPNALTDYTLTVSSNAGCSATDIVRVDVNPKPIASAGDDLAICKGESIMINGNTVAANIVWNPGNFHTSSITVNPSSTTTYTLEVSDAIGCSAKDTITINVNPLPVARFSNTSPVCINNPIDFGDLSTIPAGSVASWDWVFGDGNISNSQNPSNIYAQTGNFIVFLRVVSDAGCKDSTTSMAIVNPIPAVSAGAVQSICPGFNAVLTGTGTGNYLWSPGGETSTSITVSPAATSDYTLTLTDANGCQNSASTQVVINPVPLADAGPDQSICSGQSTTLFAHGGDFYSWSPGNVQTQDLDVTPLTTGNYSVVVSNIFGCVSTDEVSIQVNPIPTSSFSTSGAVCEDNVVNFYDHSTVATGTILAYNWDFGNNISSLSQNPAVPFYNAGSYNITLVVYSDNGCNDTSSFQQMIWPKPVASYIHTDVCEGLPIQFNSTSSIGDASPLNYSWNLGDNVTSNSSDISHQYNSYGAYTASLLVTSANGCVDSTTELINVFALPTASFGAVYSCEDSPAQFADSSVIPQGNISYWYWTFGDTYSSTDHFPTHIYSDPGEYSVHMLITSDHGCQDSIDGAIRVVPRPLVDFVTENACLGYSVNMNDSSQAVTGSIQQYNWTFGDGATSTDQNPEHMYSTSGWFEVGLTAVTDSGCATTLARPNAVNIYAPPVAAFESNSTEANDVYPLVNFVNQTSSAGTYYWSFGDGDTSSLYSPTHLYATIGVYDVDLITTDLNGCIDSTLLRVEIRPGSNIYVPNAFTPNGDSKNDVFHVYTHNVNDMIVQIYDRWGIKIVEWKDPEGGWDGRVGGEPAQADTYVYRVSTVDINAKKEVVVGHVNLVR